MSARRRDMSALTMSDSVLVRIDRGDARDDRAYRKVNSSGMANAIKWEA
jgi:hypothetical protein